MAAKAKADPPGDLGVDWSRWADGRAFRLKRKRDFPDVDPGVAREAAKEAAARMGKAVLTVRDRSSPNKFIWVQFADHKVKIGEPCPCGSRRLLRLHENFARCPECRAQLLLVKADQDEVQETRARRQLREMSDVRLWRRKRTEKHEHFRGVAAVEDETVFLLALFNADPEDDPVTEDDAVDRLVALHVVPLTELHDLVDVSALLARAEDEEPDLRLG